MLTMRSTTVTKVTKPPPPVPPRPSKSIVAEALAKRKIHPEEPTTVPVRSAPPPPPADHHQLSNVRVNFPLKRTGSAVGEDPRVSTRTVVFQSSNMKSAVSNNLLIRNAKVNVNNVTVNGGDTQSNDVVVTTNNISVGTTENCIKITQLEDSQSEVNVVACLVPSETEQEDEEGPDRDEKWDEILKDKNHVNKLIDEMFASVLDVSTAITEDNSTVTINQFEQTATPNSSDTVNGTSTTVLIIDGLGSTEKIDYNYDKSNSSTMEKKSVQFDDKKNAELLIEELESMRLEQERILKRQRKRSREIYGREATEECHDEDLDETRNCHHVNIVNLNGAEEKGTSTLDYDRLRTMSSLHGLPPLPKSLSGFNLNETYVNPPTPVRTTSMRSHHHQGHAIYAAAASNGTDRKQQSNLDAQLAILRREMFSLRQLDLSLLSQLWSLNESIQDFRQMLQDQEECRVLSPPSQSPVPSSGDEGDGDDQYYVNALPPSLKFRPAPPPPPPARKSSNSSNTSTCGG